MICAILTVEENVVNGTHQTHRMGSKIQNNKKKINAILNADVPFL